MRVSAGADGDQKRELELLQLKLQEIVRHLMWVLEAELHPRPEQQVLLTTRYRSSPLLCFQRLSQITKIVCDLILYLRMILYSQSSCLHLPTSRITGMNCHVWLSLLLLLL